MSVDEFRAELQRFAKEIMSGNPTSSPAKEIYEASKKTATDLGMGNNIEAIQKAAIQTYVMQLGREKAGVDWTAAVGLFFIGANRDAINPVTLATRYGGFNEIEASLNRHNLSSAELSNAGVKIERTVDKKYKHTIPDTVQFIGDESPVTVIKPKNINLESTDKVYDLHFSDKGDGKYVLTVTERNPQPTAGVAIMPK